MIAEPLGSRSLSRKSYAAYETRRPRCHRPPHRTRGPADLRRWQDPVARAAAGGDRGLPVLLPPLVDIQVNGYAGVDFQRDDCTVAELERAATGLAEAACSRCLLTLITNRWPGCWRALRHYQALRAASPLLQRRIAGWHLEGPFMSPRPGFHGAHPPEHMEPPSAARMHELKAIVGDEPTLLTMAPEWPEAPAAIRVARSLGFRVWLGHTDATAEQIDAAIDAGAEGLHAPRQRLPARAAPARQHHLPRARRTAAAREPHPGPHPYLPGAFPAHAPGARTGSHLLHDRRDGGGRCGSGHLRPRRHEGRGRRRRRGAAARQVQLRRLQPRAARGHPPRRRDAAHRRRCACGRLFFRATGGPSWACRRRWRRAHRRTTACCTRRRGRHAIEIHFTGEPVREVVWSE
jgi:hypothetical protein